MTIEILSFESTIRFIRFKLDCTMCYFISKKKGLGGFFLKKNENIRWQQHFLYPLLFHNDFYVIDPNLLFNSSPSFEKIEKLPNSFRFLNVKRSIKLLHQQNYLVYNTRSSCFNFIGKTSFFCFDIFVSTWWKHFFGFKVTFKEINQQVNFQSVFSLFLFLEEVFMFSLPFSNIRIPSSIHSELLIRRFKFSIQDVSFLHFLSFILFSKQFKFVNNSIIFPKGSVIFCFFLGNILLSIFEDFFTLRWKSCFHEKSLSYGLFSEQKHFQQKWNFLTRKPKKKDTIRLLKDFFFHYIRYGEKLILLGTTILVKKCEFFFLNFWQTYLFVLSEPSSFFLKQISSQNIFFLAYYLEYPTNSFLLRLNILDYFLSTDFVSRELNSKLSAVFVIQFLSKEGLCDIMGNPKSKLAWLSFTDNSILDKYDHFCRNVDSFYSGAINKRFLDRVKYILFLSCIRTLACKHKSTIRIVRKELGFELRKIFVRKQVEFKNKKLLYFCFHKQFRKLLFKIDLVTERLWFLDILEVNNFTKFWVKQQNALDFFCIFDQNIWFMLDQFL
uniref:Maturase K n=1 Tax=Ephedra intermedia TaxID=173278 RepID=B6RAL6_9SPER|nr:maturase K [Ephedra intermedia]